VAAGTADGFKLLTLGSAEVHANFNGASHQCERGALFVPRNLLKMQKNLCVQDRGLKFGMNTMYFHQLVDHAI
jgi:hypothetical protein